MTRDARSLYQALVVDHGARPRHAGPLAGATHEAVRDNPLCGDRVRLFLQLSGERVLEARFEAQGCLIARASASILTETVSGKTLDEVRSLLALFESLVRGEPPPLDAGTLEALRGVRDFPARTTCATLAWEVLAIALPPPPRRATEDVHE